MDLVTVVCKRDFDVKQLILQAESIQKFVEPCTHWVVINELDADLNFWHNILDRFYTSHTLKIWHPENIAQLIEQVPNGWDRQQVLKFLIADKLDDDYIILDSKNFFIKSCSTGEWRNVLGSGTTQDISDQWHNTAVYYANILNKPVLTQCLSIHTPFVFKIDLVKNFTKDLIPLLISKVFPPSEFIFYSYLVSNVEKTSQLGITLFPKGLANISNFETALVKLNQTDNIKCFGIHRKVFEKISSYDTDIIRNFLHDLDLKSYTLF